MLRIGTSSAFLGFFFKRSACFLGRIISEPTMLNTMAAVPYAKKEKSAALQAARQPTVRHCVRFCRSDIFSIYRTAIIFQKTALIKWLVISTSIPKASMIFTKTKIIFLTVFPMIIIWITNFVSNIQRRAVLQ